ncbi:type II CRISPR-associated endonuclease Cas1 [Melioribacter sp. Ez-97]|uniref:type II CRISPR-associated endonuclease Cas1 n=1 Tax=Melioribacter sp. Ez-97 TaxID=3423434 RepID=UPI003ED87263
MIKRTLYIGNPAYLSMKNNQLTIRYKENLEESESKNYGTAAASDIDNGWLEKRMKAADSFSRTIPIEDIGIIVLDHRQITLTHGLLDSLLENNAAIVTCNKSHMPSGLFMPLEGNNEQTKIIKAQIESSLPLKKQLWAQTIAAKIRNQAVILKKRNVKINNMITWSKKVRSGDPDNYEGRAAAYYWKNFFPMIPDFIRDRYGEPPNNLLNYGYAILRAIIARAVVGSGMLPTLGIHHSNKYNAYCLADDVMEPFRPFVDNVVYSIVSNGENFYELDSSIKKQLLDIGTLDVIIGGKRSPLMIAAQRTSSSLARCFEGKARKIAYPELEI